jgi:hypothetical protein
MGAIGEGLCIENSRRITIELIRGLEFRCAKSAVDKKFDPNWNTEGTAVQTTEDPFSVAPLAILVEIVLAVGVGVGAEAEVVAQASLE